MMDDSKQTSGKGIGDNQSAGDSGLEPSRKAKKKKWTTKASPNADARETLIKVGGLEYKAPGRRQRVVLGAIVLGGNLLLVLATILYFYNPAFKEFISTVGK